MGSSQSSPSTSRTNDQDASIDSSMKEIPLQQMNNVSSSSSSKPHLSGISLIEYNCRKKKRRWSKCVSEHYEKKFLPGKSLEPEEDCDDFFDAYRTCYMKGLLKERQRKGLPPPKEGTLLHEFMEEEGLTKAPNDNNNNNISMEHDKR